MNLHLVGGFLGSGKTTAIIGAARLLAARRSRSTLEGSHSTLEGPRVGVVTNHQGKALVDTAFFRAAQLPTVEVTGGCFCCHYDDLAARLEQLHETARPDVIFAESVGSCADLVATVVKPLLLFNPAFTPSSFSVFADSRLLRRRLLGEPLPFSDEVVYIFDQQIEEAGLLVVNKVDLLGEPALDELRDLVARRWPGKAALFHSALAGPDLAHGSDLTGFKKPVRSFAGSFAGIEDWLALIESGAAPVPQASLQIDYPRYGAAEARLAWMDMGVKLAVRDGEGRGALVRLLEGIQVRLKARGAGLGHLKAIIRWAAGEVKVSLTALEDPGWREQVPAVTGQWVYLILNAHVEISPSDLQALVRESLAACGAAYTIERADSFAPGFPNPTHRLG